MHSRVIGLVVIITICGILGSATSASALVILGQLNSFATGPDNSAANGGGNIAAVFEAAANEWEKVLLDDRTITIPFGWVSGNDPLGFSDGVSVFIPSGNPWFVDATPDFAEEYTTTLLSSAAIDGFTLNYSMTLGGATGVAAAKFDLFSVLLHEIGHILSFGPNAFADYSDGDVDVTAPRPLAGVELPVAGGCCHLAKPSGYTGGAPLMFPFFDTGERRLISDADLLFVAQTNDWTQLAPERLQSIPEPAAVALFSVGAIGAALRRRRSAHHGGSVMKRNLLR